MRAADALPVRWLPGTFKSERLDLDNRLEWRKILINNDLDDTATRISLSLSITRGRARGRSRINLLADAIIRYSMPFVRDVSPLPLDISYLAVTMLRFQSANYLVESWRSSLSFSPSRYRS